MRRHLFKRAGWLPAAASLLLISLPHGALILLAAMEWAEGKVEMTFPWDGKSVSALTVSLGLSLAVAVLSVGLAIGLSLLLAKMPSRFGRWAVLVAAIIGFCLSPVIHLIAWRTLPFALTVPPFVAATAVLAWKYFPLALFMMVLGLHALEPGGIEAGAAVSAPRSAALRLILPQIRWVLALASGVIFALVFAEAEVPPLLGLRVYAEEFMGRIALDSYTGTAVLAGLPFIVLAMLAAAMLLCLNVTAGGLAWSRSGLVPLLRYFRSVRHPSLVGLMVALAVCWPCLVLMHSAHIEALAGPDWQALTTSLLLGLLSLFVALCLAYPIAEVMRNPGWGREWVLAWMIMLLCLPGSLLGLGMVALSQVPGLEWMNTGDVSLILTHGLRFAPIAALLLLGLRLLEPGWMRDELRMTGAGRLAALRSIHAPLDWPKWLAIGVVLLALMLSELASTILVVAPGTETAILRLYNLMHYGAAERVNALALSQAGLVALIFIFSGGLLMRHVRHA